MSDRSDLRSSSGDGHCLTVANHQVRERMLRSIECCRIFLKHGRACLQLRTGPRNRLSHLRSSFYAMPKEPKAGSSMSGSASACLSTNVSSNRFSRIINEVVFAGYSLIANLLRVIDGLFGTFTYA